MQLTETANLELLYQDLCSLLFSRKLSTSCNQKGRDQDKYIFNIYNHREPHDLDVNLPFPSGPRKFGK